MVELNYLDITKTGEGHIKVPAKGVVAPAITESIAKSALASFADGAAGIPVKSLIADINPVQSGSGDPSPSNVRPITGWTGMNVVRTGKNLLNTEDMVAGILNASGAVDVQSVTIGTKTKASITWTSSATWRGVTSDYIPVTAGGHYYLSLTETVSYVFYAWYDANKTFISRASYNGSSMQSVTAPSNAAFVRYTLQEATAGTFTYHNIQLESGSSVTTYEPYNGTTYPISWADEAGTVYGGTLDVTSGVLTVDRAMYTFTGQEGWTKQTGTPSGYTKYWSSSPSSGYLVSNAKYPANNNLAVPIQTSIGFFERSYNTLHGYPYEMCIASDGRIGIEGSLYTGSGTLQGQQLVYELATPQTYQLTPQAVMTILGQNNIWADTGDVEVAYCADTKLYIDKVIAAL